MAEALLDELVEEILLRISPDDPVHLVRAAVVCRRWRRLASDPGFRRRFNEFHRPPTLLGFLCNLRDGRASPFDLSIPLTLRFVPASPVVRAADRINWLALDSRHGRVLLQMVNYPVATMAVWDPITDKQVDLPPIPQHPVAFTGGWNAAVLSGGDDHLGSNFLVVVVGCAGAKGIFTCVYSSESDAWSEVASAKPMPIYGPLHLGRPVLAANAIYMFKTSGIVKYDLATQKMSEILPPDTVSSSNAVLMTTEDGLGFAGLKGSKLCLWSWEAGSDKGASWAQTKVIQLARMLPPDALLTSPRVLGFADGLGLIFVWTIGGLFTVDPKYNKVTKVGELRDVQGDDNRINYIVPHTSFCTPDSR